jgi:hypothetical protein
MANLAYFEVAHQAQQGPCRNPSPPQAIPLPSTPGRFKEGVFGGDKVEVLIQHLLIEADQEGGYERCS